MSIKEIGFVAIPISDMQRAQEFYEGLLGLKQTQRFHAGKWIEYSIGKDTLALSSLNSGWRSSGQGTIVALETGDFEEAIAELKKAKVPFAREPFESPVCRIAIVEDPDGNKLMIHHLKTRS